MFTPLVIAALVIAALVIAAIPTLKTIAAVKLATLVEAIPATEPIATSKAVSPLRTPTAVELATLVEAIPAIEPIATIKAVFPLKTFPTLVAAITTTITVTVGLAVKATTVRALIIVASVTAPAAIGVIPLVPRAPFTILPTLVARAAVVILPTTLPAAAIAVAPPPAAPGTIIVPGATTRPAVRAILIMITVIARSVPFAVVFPILLTFATVRSSIATVTPIAPKFITSV
ncbi:hypothetical protein [Actinobaculum massiliense]|uniref:hypothetical protein n=1 Tax=Actinobaculum massiliense TaxID=202789 RepID=UPI00138AF714|nr:hypothetical protein [Actinobaculum massiliense]MDK8319055.1 hypothetical protein [Actinobaculum massiliense]MDK8567187.1 hypothetical protein [Actinobaculum massiliense]